MNSIDPARRRDLEAAMRHHRAGRLREAVAAYENLLRVTPDDADVMQLLGVALGQLGNHEAAVRFLERSLQLKPDRPTVLLKRSDLLRRMAGLTLTLGLHWGQWDVVQTLWSAWELAVGYDRHGRRPPIACVRALAPEAAAVCDRQRQAPAQPRAVYGAS